MQDFGEKTTGKATALPVENVYAMEFFGFPLWDEAYRFIYRSMAAECMTTFRSRPAHSSRTLL